MLNSSGEWICQFVGMSGDQDPFVLRHCSFNQLNCYKAPDWAILRIKGEPSSIPLHFTVSLNFKHDNICDNKITVTDLS